MDKGAMDGMSETSLVHNAVRVIAPLAAGLAEDCRAAGRPLVLGMSGCPGSGKSTAARLLQLSLSYHGLTSARLSLDDLYLSRAGREALARDVHPLFRTRGVPGTHDAALGERVLDGIARGEAMRLPRFDKAKDDLRPETDWPLVEAPDLLIFEGWCVGTTPQSAECLVDPVNALEREEDGDAVWRTYANNCLRTYGETLFARIDRLVHLLAADTGNAWRWRREQEARLRERPKRCGEGAGHIMSDADIDRFLQHFERLMRHHLTEGGRLPGQDFTIETDRRYSPADVL